MKKFTGILFACALVFTSISSPTFASEVSSKKVTDDDYKKMMAAVKEEVLNGATDLEIEALPEVQEFRNTYTEAEIRDYILNVEAIESYVDGKAFTELTSTTNNLEDTRQKVVEFEDGSFVVLGAKTTKTSDPLGSITSPLIQPLNPITSPLIQPLGTTTHFTEYYNGKPGATFQDDFWVNYWGMWKVAELHLITNYKVSSLSKMEITSTSHAGTKAITPSSVDNVSTRIVTNKAGTVRAEGSYRKTLGVVLDGQPIGSVKYIDLVTTIHLHADNGTNAYFYVQNQEID